MHRYVTLPKDAISHTDFVRICVILSFSLSSIFICFLALSQHLPLITPQLFYFPIIYAAYFYHHRGIYVAGACAIAYQAISYYYIFPSIFDMSYATGQSVLFICIAASVSHYTERLATSEGRYRSIFESSRVGIVFFNEGTLSIVLANDHLIKVLGYSSKEINKMTVSQLFFSRDDQRNFMRQFGSRSSANGMETRFLTKSGDPVWVNLSWNHQYGNLMSMSVIDITEQKTILKTAEANSAQNRLLMDTSPTGMAIFRDNQILRTNPAFTGFTEYTGEELAGKNPSLLVHPDDRRVFSDIISKSGRRNPVLGNPEFQFMTKTGMTKTAAVFFLPIIEGGGPAILITCLDMSERETLKELIRQDNKRRRGVLINVAHELRTPLQPLIGYLELLLDEQEKYGISMKTEEILGRCLMSADREWQIINQMINLAVIDTGKLPLEYSAFSVTDLLQNIIDASGYSMKADITIDLPPDLTFIGDSNKISIVLDSILSNAITYSASPRNVRITYHSHADDTYNRLAISDNGIGITESHLDEIFEPFHLADSDKLSRKYERIGLSLAISKKYIQMHGGYISVDSVVNKGSTFTIHIPKTPHEENIEPDSFDMWL